MSETYPSRTSWLPLASAQTSLNEDAIEWHRSNSVSCRPYTYVALTFCIRMDIQSYLLMKVWLLWVSVDLLRARLWVLWLRAWSCWRGSYCRRFYYVVRTTLQVQMDEHSIKHHAYGWHSDTCMPIPIRCKIDGMLSLSCGDCHSLCKVCSPWDLRRASCHCSQLTYRRLLCWTLQLSWASSAAQVCETKVFSDSKLQLQRLTLSGSCDPLSFCTQLLLSQNS